MRKGALSYTTGAFPLSGGRARGRGGRRGYRLKIKKTLRDYLGLFLTLPGMYPSADGNGNSPSTINGWCVGVWSGSKVKEAAGKFVEAMMSPESDELWVTLGGQLAIRKSTMEKLGDFYEDPNNRYLTVVADGITNAGWPQPTDYPVSSWKNDLNRAAQMVMVDGSSIPDALASVAKDFDERNGG